MVSTSEEKGIWVWDRCSFGDRESRRRYLVACLVLAERGKLQALLEAIAELATRILRMNGWAVSSGCNVLIPRKALALKKPYYTLLRAWSQAELKKQGYDMSNLISLTFDKISGVHIGEEVRRHSCRPQDLFFEAAQGCTSINE